ncbi:MAG: leucine-rich repeat domain-containing protein [Clostridia bacterium]|nr:leucine-rich repeat domain-containing protein [Clostridia bacterium]
MKDLSKKLTSFFLILVILSMAFQANCIPTMSGEYGNNITWVLTNTGKLTISGNGAMDDATSGSKPWHGLEQYIVSVTVNEGVTHIGNYVFNMFNKMTSVKIAHSVTTIGEYAFCGCSNLRSIRWSNNLTSIGNKCFSECSSLSNLVIPDSVITIGDEAFANCQNLIDAIIGTGATTISVGAFRQCTSLNNVVLNDGLQLIGSESFLNCINLKTVCYGGTENQWYRISIGNDNSPLQSARRFYHKHNENTTTSCLNYLAPTCTDYGFSGDVYYLPCGIQKSIGVTLEPLGHNYQEEVVPATCFEDGQRLLVCQNCGDFSVIEDIKALGHNWDEGTTTKEATCTEDGVTTFTCQNDNTHTKTEVILAKGHSYKTVVTLPSCESKGFTTYTCTRCEDNYVTDEKASIGHSWDAGIVTKDATCTEEGVLTFTCLNDNSHTRIESIPLKEHTYEAIITEPTCESNGFITYICSYCGDHFTTGSASATGHIFGAWLPTKAATVYADGEEIQICAKCGKENKRSLPKLPMPKITIQHFTFSSPFYDFRSTIVFRADVENAIVDGQVQWYVDGEYVYTGTIYTATDVRNGFNLMAKYTDGISVLSQTDTERVNVNTSFFAKIRAFFRALFGKLPNLTQEWFGSN